MRVTMCALAAVVLFAGLVGCSKGDPTNPVGTWNLDTSALLEEMKKNPNYKADDPMTKQMEEALKKMKVTMVVNADNSFTGTAEGMGNKSTAKGTWKLEGDKLTMTTTEEDGKPKSETEVLTFKDGLITMEKEGMKMTMRR